jgi:hypothetical protein
VIDGSTYRVAGANFPTGPNWGWEPVTFDGIAESVNGGQLLINERQFAVPGGVWHEVSIDRTDGLTFSNPAVRPFHRFTALDIEHDQPVVFVPEIGSAYIYFTIDGVEAPLVAAPNGELRPHPFDPAVGNIWFSPNLGGTEILDVGHAFSDFAIGNVYPPGANGVRVGLLFRELPQPIATGFDFDLLRLEITGQNAFSDEFEDGQRHVHPTRSLVDIEGTTTEAEGALVFRDSDGTSSPFWYALRDLVVFDRTFQSGRGSAEITATISPLTPGSYQQALGLLFDRRGSPVVFSIEWLDEDLGFKTPCSGSLQATLRSGSRPIRSEVLACDAIDPASVTGDIVLKARLDDESDELRISYSTDGGQSFVSDTEFEVVAPAQSILGEGETARLFLAASGTALQRDLDGDGMVYDLCPDDFEEERLELGLQSMPDGDGDFNIDSDGNGIGDDCECGDQNEDGTVDVRDILWLNNRFFAQNPPPLSPLCDANGDGACNPNELLAINLVIYGEPGTCARYPNP